MSPQALDFDLEWNRKKGWKEVYPHSHLLYLQAAGNNYSSLLFAVSQSGPSVASTLGPLAVWKVEALQVKPCALINQV